MEFLQTDHIRCQCLAVLTILTLLLIAQTSPATAAAVDRYDYDIEELLINRLMQRPEQTPELLRADDDITLLGCHIKVYLQPIDKSLVLSTGDILLCQDNVTVLACWGGCDSSEIADYRIPYKISNHPVCMYTGRTTRRVKLQNCDVNHPNPWVDVFDATGCSCQRCNHDNTYCEHLNG